MNIADRNTELLSAIEAMYRSPLSNDPMVHPASAEDYARALERVLDPAQRKRLSIGYFLFTIFVRTAIRNVLLSLAVS